MLTAIELSGFKSFADRTRLEFSDGISALVGPNGSGKSNVVDAIKWVLGEQSMKKLRGSEATDVIFSGSATRDAVGAAEVTLTFDNSTQIFPNLETREVHITRRIYRSGEGEYLVNRQPSRLRDIKELLAGTGLGTQAYSIIEQGRVESLLQSTPMQRRGIFEDAAGISRFHAKKIEAGRRLERVDQNLVRVSDIVGEVEQQLKTAKTQAGKAQQYREYTARLQELRTDAARIDWRRLRDAIEVSQKAWDSEAQRHSDLVAVVERLESDANGCAADIEHVDAAIRATEKALTTTTERIASALAATEQLAAQHSQVEDEVQQTVAQMDEMRLKWGDAGINLFKTKTQAAAAEQNCVTATAAYETCRLHDIALAEQVESQRRRGETLRDSLIPYDKEIVRIQSEIANNTASRASLAQDHQRHVEKLRGLASRRATLVAAEEIAAAQLANLAAQVAVYRNELDAIRTRKETRATKRERLLEELSERRQRHSALSERAKVLEDLVNRYDGLSPGVREVLQESKNADSPFRHAHGLVADIFHVDVGHAMLIDLALGPKAQQVVVSPEPELFRHIERRSNQFAGRVGFIWLDPRTSGATESRTGGANDSQQNNFSLRPGVIGRADKLVHTSTLFAPLAQRLLGRIWIVENLTVAKKLYRESDDVTSFLTVSGEMLEADGTLVVGPQQMATGLISRRSELRSVSDECATLAVELDEMQRAIQLTQENLAGDEKAFDVATQRLQNASKERDAKEVALRTAQEQLKQIAEQENDLAQEIAVCQQKQTLTIQQSESLASELAAQESHRAAIRDSLAVVERELVQIEAAWHTHEDQMTAAKVERAKSEERLAFLRDRLSQVEERCREQIAMREENTKRRRQLTARTESLELAMLSHHATLATLYAQRESLLRDHRERGIVRAWLADFRKRQHLDLKKRQSELNQVATQTHKHQSEVERLRLEQKALAHRFYEEYAIDIAAFDRANAPSEKDSASNSADAARELDELRQKIQKLGYVNLESIETLDSLTARYDLLSQQCNDLISAKRATERLIERVNGDTQRMFEETFDGVKLHFREIFQQLFGGGTADLVLENPDAPLESGVEIVARPPGKDLRSVTLMSGGEKTLTCVALLLAFFAYRPNPVCILDEVDAALDEGNIDRFVRVIRDFRLATQFLIITHSKKTMACASTLYGITMQESGVSKPISVRFVDVGEHGEILQSPPDDEPETAIFSIDTPEHKAAA